MRALKNKVLIEIEKKMEDTVTYGSMELHIDPMFKPQHNARIYGTVVGVSDEEEELSLGDKVYFHYLVVDDSHAFDNIYTVDSVDEAMTLLTGKEAGELSSRNRYPKGSVNYLAVERLREISVQVNGSHEDE